MGRGRQKAKHTKVARDLKYFSPDTNYGALQKELAGNPGDPKLAEDLAAWPEYVGATNTDDDSDEYDDVYDSDEYDSESDEDIAQHKSA